MKASPSTGRWSVCTWHECPSPTWTSGSWIQVITQHLPLGVQQIPQMTKQDLVPSPKTGLFPSVLQSVGSSQPSWVSRMPLCLAHISQPSKRTVIPTFKLNLTLNTSYHSALWTGVGTTTISNLLSWNALLAGRLCLCLPHSCLSSQSSFRASLTMQIMSQSPVQCSLVASHQTE